MPGPTGDVHGTGDFDFKSFFLDIPPVTRTIVILTFFSTLFTGLGLFPISLFLLEWSQVIYKFQIWRLVLTFFHVGQLGLRFLIRMYFLFTYSQQLEVGTFFGRPANYAWFLSFVSIFVLATSSLFTSYINSGAWLLAIIHLWGRHADNVSVSMYGFIQIPAKYLSLVMLLLDVIIQGSFAPSDGLGLLGGHLYYFLDSVFPTMPEGKQLIFTPIWFERLIDQIQNILSNITGLNRGLRAVSGSRNTPSSAYPTTPAGSNRQATSSTSFRSGFTAPQVRGSHSWGSGNTLGST